MPGRKIAEQLAAGNGLLKLPAGGGIVAKRQPACHEFEKRFDLLVPQVIRQVWRQELAALSFDRRGKVVPPKMHDGIADAARQSFRVSPGRHLGQKFVGNVLGRLAV